MNDNLINFLRQRQDLIPIDRPADLDRFLHEIFDRPYETLPIPAKIFLVDELKPHSYGFPITKSAVLDDAATLLEKWIVDEILTRSDRNIPKSRAEFSLSTYREAILKLARNALHSSILADYHAVFWLVHSAAVAKTFSTFRRRALNATPVLTHEQADVMKYLVAAKWREMIDGVLTEITGDTGVSFAATEAVRKEGFVRLLLDNPLIATEEFIGPDLRELATYFSGCLRRDFNPTRTAFEMLHTTANEFMAADSLFRRAVLHLGYRDADLPIMAIFDERVQQLILDHPSFDADMDLDLVRRLSHQLLQFLVIQQLRRGIAWMHTTKEGENVGDERSANVAYSRAIRPLNFGRRGIVEPIVYRFGLVYDITSFTQTLGEIARGGKQEEDTTYRQMLEFQRDLADVTNRHGLSFEKFLGDGAFYTSRRATRTLLAAIDIQTFYATARASGFAFNKGMRMALNYGYYRLLPMQITSEGTAIKEFYGPGIVELSRLTTGKTTKEIEDIQHLLLSHGYDQMEVYRFFAPLSRGEGDTEWALGSREFYAYVDENGHLVNEGIVASIPFLKQLSEEFLQDGQRLYRLRTSWSSYFGIPAAEPGAYIGARIIGSVSLKGIGNQDVAEVVRVDSADAEVSLIDKDTPFIQLLEQERYRRAATKATANAQGGGTADLVVCQSREAVPVILVGEWDPVSEEVRRPIQLGEDEAERYGLEVPITAASVESQSTAFQKLYHRLSMIETLPNVPVQAIRTNAKFHGFIIGATVERL